MCEKEKIGNKDILILAMLTLLCARLGIKDKQIKETITKLEKQFNKE